jgi:hypothetical protein
MVVSVWDEEKADDTKEMWWSGYAWATNRTRDEEALS